MGMIATVILQQPILAVETDQSWFATDSADALRVEDVKGSIASYAATNNFPTYTVCCNLG